MHFFSPQALFLSLLHCVHTPLPSSCMSFFCPQAAVNFAIFSSSATAISLCLFTEADLQVRRGSRGRRCAGRQGGLEGDGQLAVAAPDRGQTCRWGREAGRAGGEGQRLRSYFLTEAGSYRLILWT